MEDEKRIIKPSPEMLTALALVSEGHSYRYVSRETGLPTSTICDNAIRAGIAPGCIGREDLAVVRRDVEELRVETSRQLREALHDGRIKDEALPATVGMLTTQRVKIAEVEARRPSGNDQQERVGQALDRMVSAGVKATLTLEPVKPDEQAIDITPIKETEPEG